MEQTALPMAELRRRAGFSQRELAARIGIHHLTVNALENNPKRIPRPSTMRKVADGIGCEVTDIKEFLRVRRTPRKRHPKTRRTPALV